MNSAVEGLELERSLLTPVVLVSIRTKSYCILMQLGALCKENTQNSNR